MSDNDQKSQSAVRIITDLTMPAKRKLASGRGDTVFMSTLTDELKPLVEADLQIAHMLDELDQKTNVISNGVVALGESHYEAIAELQAKYSELEGRTLRGRIRSALRWLDRLSQRFETWLTDLRLRA